ncbi:MAG: serine/threonine-protein kinase [Solirubrobacterales bacterium]
MSDIGRLSELGEGSEFAGYRIERLLGKGGMGIVYLAVEPSLERRVALKLIAPDAASEKVFRDRFAHESKIAASIEHPNVVPIYAAGEERGVPFIAMRYVTGSDLARRLRVSGRLDPEHGAALIGQVASGLDAIHAAGLVHRDVKPANVLLSGAEGEEHAYITDFGVARNVASTSGLTRTGRFVGTLDYVAPEQIRGREVDARADVYALGCLLHKTLTGEVPFPREGEAARLYAHLNDDPPAPSLFVPRVPAALDAVVARAMSKDPDDRFPSAGDLGRAAQAAVAGRSVGVPERTVATGAAATRTAETIVGDDPAGAPQGGTASATPGESIPAETEAISPARGTPGPPRGARGRVGGGPRRRRLVAAGVGALALGGVAVALITGGGGNGSGAGGQTRAGAGGQGARQGGTGAGSQVQPLPRDEFVARVDAACVAAQESFTAANRDFNSGATDDLGFAKVRFGISKRQLAAMEPLLERAPVSVRGTYRQYVQAIGRVHSYDAEALDAARKGDAAGIDAANQKNAAEGEARYNLARDIGLRDCSTNPNPKA